MTNTEFTDSLIKATPGDGSYAGARKLYLSRGLAMTLLERLRAVERMAETAAFLQKAAMCKHAAE